MLFSHMIGITAFARFVGFAALPAMLPAFAKALPRTFRATVSNAAPDAAEVVERMTEAGESAERTRPLRLVYPPDIYSLSHVALPFPPSDPLYGLQPDSSEDFGINPGAMAGRGSAASSSSASIRCCGCRPIPSIRT